MSDCIALRRWVEHRGILSASRQTVLREDARLLLAELAARTRDVEACRGFQTTQQAEIARLRVALARICCESWCNPHNIADEALGFPASQEKMAIIKAAEQKEGK